MTRIVLNPEACPECQYFACVCAIVRDHIPGVSALGCGGRSGGDRVRARSLGLPEV